MSYDEAFEALANGDFRTALPLLERAAQETGYTSQNINHAYTVALYRSGDKARLAEVSYRIGTMLVEQDRPSALDYFQRALFAGLDPERVREIEKLFESWAVRSSAYPFSGAAVKRVAHIIGCALPTHSPAQYVKTLVMSLRLQGIESTVFTTEWATSWFFNSADTLQSQAVHMNTEVRIGAVEGDFVQRAERIAHDIQASKIEVAFFHGGLMEQITALVAVLRPVPLQIAVHHGTDMDADLFDGNIYLFRTALERARFPHLAEWIPLSSDIESRLQKSEPLTRRSMGLESATTISATFGNLQEMATPGYLRVLVEIMNRFPMHLHVFAGSGNVRSIRSHLHSEGVLPRVRFLGDVSDVAPLLGMIDVYFASFPRTGDQPIVDAMGAGKPVVVLRSPSDLATSCGPELVGVRELIAPGEADYIEIADRLLRTPAFRAIQGNAVLDRFRSELGPERFGQRYKAFLAKF